MKSILFKTQLLILTIFLFTLSACSNTGTDVKVGMDIKGGTGAVLSRQTPEPSTSPQQNTPEPSKSTNAPSTAVNGQLKVSFIDVGQADSILIQSSSTAMLIDAGNNGDSKTIISYIKQQGIKKLDYVIGTHPHEDH